MKYYIEEKLNNLAVSDRGEEKIEYLIIHSIGLNLNESLDILGSKDCSAHYFIPQLSTDENGYKVYKLVDESKSAWHAGISAWKNNINLNKKSIGIEIHSPGSFKEIEGGRDWYHFEPFTEDQIKVAFSLISNLVEKYNIPKNNVLAHSDISFYRSANNYKTDPGPFFPWKKLFDEHQIGINHNILENAPFGCEVKDIKGFLKNIGYSIEADDVLDEKTKYCIKAFEMHFGVEGLLG